MKILATAAAAALMASTAFAGTYETRCTTKSVPYQTKVKGGQPERVIGSALIGGVLGKVITNDNAGAAAGALIGGAVAHENSRKTVTRYKDVRKCYKVYVPSRITDQTRLENALLDLNSGRSLSRETIKDVQYTIGVYHDGKWGPKSRRAARSYLARFDTQPTPDAALYSLIVNDVLIVSSANAHEVGEIKTALHSAGIESQIVVDLH